MPISGINKQKLFLSNKCGAYGWRNKLSFDLNDFCFRCKFKINNEYSQHWRIVRIRVNPLSQCSIK